MIRHLIQSLTETLSRTGDVSTTSRSRRSSRRFSPGQDLNVGRGLECLEARRLLSDLTITVTNSDNPPSDPDATVMTMTMTDTTALVA